MSALTLFTIVLALTMGVHCSPKWGHDSMENTDPATRLNQLKCKSVFKAPVGQDHCARKKEQEASLTTCITSLGLDKGYKAFYDSEGKYVSEPRYAYMRSEIKRNSTAGSDLRCCSYKASGMVNDKNVINMDKLIQEFTAAAVTDAQLLASIQAGKKVCTPTTDCNVWGIQMCFCRNCEKTAFA